MKTLTGTFVNGLLYHLGDEGRKRLLIEATTENILIDGDDDDDVIEEFQQQSDDDENDDDIDVFLTNDDGVLTPSGKYTKDILPVIGATTASSLLDLPETPEAAKASPKSLRPGVVHRLDKGTSGVLIAAKHNDAVAKLSNLFAKRDITKIYLA